MEDIQLFLLIIGMIAFTIIKFIKKATEVTIDKPLQTENALEDTIEDALHMEDIEPSSVKGYILKEKLKRTLQPQTSFTTNSTKNRENSPITAPSAENNLSTTSSSAAPIRLNNRSEAKRAFIYSEIFNRKY